MSRTSDVVLIGAGHNGLVCGAYLARAGLSVTVLESSHSPGGCIYTEDQPSGNRLELGAYEHGGIRACEIGSVMLGDHAVMELVRLAIPRRTYTQSHIDYVIEIILDLRAQADSIGGFRITDQPRVLRHFTARFAPVVGTPG